VEGRRRWGELGHGERERERGGRKGDNVRCAELEDRVLVVLTIHRQPSCWFSRASSNLNAVTSDRDSALHICTHKTGIQGERERERESVCVCVCV